MFMNPSAPRVYYELPKYNNIKAGEILKTINFHMFSIEPKGKLLLRKTF